MMGQPVDLNLKNAAGSKLVHKYYPGAPETSALLVALPGDHYGVDGPLLYYPAMALHKAGWSTLALTYGYQSMAEPFSLGALPEMVSEVTGALSEVLHRDEPARVALLGKSLGAALIATLATVVPELEHARMVYLTPPLDVPLFAPAFLATRQESLIVLGDADRYYDRARLEEMRSGRHFELLEVEGGDHSLMVKGGLKPSLEALERVVGVVLKFLTG